MAFDPDAYLAGKNPTSTVSPTATAAGGFDPDKYLKEKSGSTTTTKPTENASESAFGRFVKENTREGVPLDTEYYLPASTRARISFESDPLKRAALLQKEPGILEVRLSKDGRHPIATIDDNGQRKDVLLDPAKGVNLAGNAVPAAKVGVAGLAAYLTGGASLPVTLGTMAGTGAALEGGTRALSRAAADEPLDAPDLAKEAAIGAAVNSIVPGGQALAQGGRALLAKGAGALEQRAIEAAARQGLPITPSQGTGSAALARSANLPLAGGAAARTEQEGALKAAMDRQIGPGGVPSAPPEAMIAGRAQPLIAANAKVAEEGVETGLRNAATEAEGQINNLLDQNLGKAKATQSDAGAIVRGKVEAQRDLFQKQAQESYKNAYAQAAEEDLKLSTKPITKLAREIGDKDPQGAIQQLVPEVKRIFGLQAALDAEGTMTLPQAVELRALVNDQIGRGQAVGSIPDRYLKKLAEALTDSIDQGVAKGSKKLQALYGGARDSYASEIGKFKNSDVGRFFAEEGTARRLGDNEIIPNLFRGKGDVNALRALKEVLGEKSPEYRLLLRQGLSGLAEESGTTGGLLNAKQFVNKLDALSPEMRAEVLGSAENAVRANARILDAARGGKIDPVDLEEALRGATGNTSKLYQTATKRAAQVEQEYRSGIMKQIRDGTLDPRSVSANPDEFVTRFVNNASTADVKQVMAQLDTKTNEMIRQRTLANILEDVKVKPEVGKITTGETVLSDPAKLQKYTSGADREKYKVLLGDNGVQFLDDLATINEAIAKEKLQAGSPGTAEKVLGFIGNLAGGPNIGGAAGRTAGKALAYVPRQALGLAQRKELLRDFFLTGRLPEVNPALRAAALAAPEAEKERQQALSQDPPQ